MYFLKIILLLLHLIYVKAQLNSCTTPEGNEGVCMNIWECSHRIKYLFSEQQNSIQTYNTLKSVCDYTDSVIKLCCSDSSSNTESKNTEMPTKRKNDKDCETNNTSTEDVNDDDRKIANRSHFNKSSEHHFEDDDDVEADDDKAEEKKEEEKPKQSSDREHVDGENMHRYESIELTATESSTTECNQKSSNTNTTDTLIFNNETVKPKEDKLKEETDSRELLNNNNNNNNASVEFKILMNSDNEVNNNTFIIVNMKDNSNFVNNNDNATFIVTNLGEPTNIQTNTSTSTNSSINPPNTNNTNNNMSIGLFKKILCLILGKNSTELVENETSPNNLSRQEDKPSDYDSINSSEAQQPNYMYSSEETEEDFNYITLPNPPYCGRNTKRFQSKGEYAWQVLLKEEGSRSTKQFCKGTLVTREHVVTTANCVINRNIESILIRSQKISAYITLKIKDIIVHEHFVPHHVQYDIALIMLGGPIELAEVSPICLKVDSHLTKNLTDIVAYAPGYIKYGYRNAGEPHSKAQRVISQYECINELYDLREYMEINEHVICTNNKPDEEDICLENEGSPLLIRGKTNGQIYYYQIGIVSKVNQCSDHNSHPGIFVNINLYLNWILKNM